jgi:hypothetical protein
MRSNPESGSLDRQACHPRVTLRFSIALYLTNSHSLILQVLYSNITPEQVHFLRALLEYFSSL